MAYGEQTRDLRPRPTDQLSVACGLSPELTSPPVTHLDTSRGATRGRSRFATFDPFTPQMWILTLSFIQGMFEILEADIVVFQETKIQRKDLRDDMVLVPGWDCYFSLPKHKKGEPFPISFLAASLSPARLFWSSHLHTKCHLCSNPCRRRHHWRPYSSEYSHELQRPSRR